MHHHSIPTAAELPQLTLVNGHPTCLSTDVARHFGKRHDDVLKAIRALLVELPDSHLRNFAEMEIDVEIGLGKVRKSPAYRLTRDGFTLLCMGFTVSTPTRPNPAASPTNRNAPDATRLLDEEQKGTQIVRTPGGDQRVTIISLSCLPGAARSHHFNRCIGI